MKTAAIIRQRNKNSMINGVSPSKEIRSDMHRKRDLSIIHIAKKQLALDDADYQQIIKTVTGKLSSADLDSRGRQALIKHFQKIGFKLKPKSGTTRTMADDAESKKIRAIWLMLHSLDAIKNPSEAALEQFVKRMTGIDRLQWLNSDQSKTVIETLKKWAMRFLPTWIESYIAVLLTNFNLPDDLHRSDAGQSLLARIQALRNAQARGLTALFDYYWQIWEAAGSFQSGGAFDLQLQTKNDQPHGHINTQQTLSTIAADNFQPVKALFAVDVLCSSCSNSDPDNFTVDDDGIYVCDFCGAEAR